MLASPQRSKVITFIGNFSGKTLFSLNFSKHGPQLTESDRDAFRPYYAQLLYLDPFAPDAESQLRNALKGGDVALIWFEVLRGGMCEALPANLLRIIDELKSECGYLVGVDEVLTGGWRTGQEYLAHTGLVHNSDIVAIGKTLSDMTAPMAAVLVTEDVFARAERSNPQHVARLKAYYRNQLTAHLCVNALRDALGEEQRAACKQNQLTIECGLREIALKSKLFSEVRGRGTLQLLVMNHRYFPFHHRSKIGNLLEMAMSHLIFERCGVFVFLLRFLHRVRTDDRDARELLQRLNEGLADVTPLMVYRYAVSRILSAKLPRLALMIGGQLTRTEVNTVLRPIAGTHDGH
jgi:acetylornithine/succinyldiaminopimelate/putrescine aminotransferase